MTQLSGNGLSDWWPDRLAQISDERCDLDVLLRDEWRHRIVARDDGAVRPTARRVSTIDGARYEALRAKQPLDGAASLGIVALAALHTALNAFGRGSKTVVAFVNPACATGESDASVLPTIVDHTEQAAMTCGAVLETIRGDLDAIDTYQRASELLGRSLFDTALIYTDGELTLSTLPATPLVAIVEDRKSAGCLTWTIVYAAELFDHAVIGGLLDVMHEVLFQYATLPDRLVRDLELISKAQESQLANWNATDGEFPEGKRLNELFEDCARREPDRLAVVFRSKRLTYRQLDERANQVAHLLLSPSVRVHPGDVVGLYLDKSELGVIATFAIWKAGAAYVPIDPSYPVERVRLSIVDTEPTAIITNARYASRLRRILDTAKSCAVIIEVEVADAATGSAADMPCEKPLLNLSSKDLAYVTYTSGTTGVPKGVPKDHRSVVNSITNLSARYDMQRPGEERVALYASYVFEPHLRQTLIALINGQTLVIIPDDVRLDPDLFPAYLAEHGVTYLNATGSVLQHFDLERCPSLKKVLLVGEELTTAGLQQLRKHYKGPVVNEYAFTDSAFVTAIQEFAPDG